jgi:hypothetical protein
MDSESRTASASSGLPASPPAEASSATNKAYNWSLLLVLLVTLVPILIVRYPDMIDYHNHLARCYILAHYHSTPIFHERYSVVPTPSPELAMDLVVVPLLRILPLLVAGKVFLALTVVLFVLGSSAVGKAVAGKPNWLALVCALTFYNYQSFFGFVDFMFGIGVFLCTFALWLRWRNHMTAWRFAACGCLAIAAYLSHLSSIIFLGIACLVYTADDFSQDRRWKPVFLKLAWFAFPLPLLWLFLHAKGHPEPLRWVSFESLWDRILLFRSPFDSYSGILNRALDVIFPLCVIALMIGAKRHPLFRVSMIFLAGVFMTPSIVMHVYHVPERWVIPMWLCLMLSLQPRRGKVQQVAFVVLFGAMMVRMADTTRYWLSASEECGQMLAIGQALPQGASVFVIQPAPLTSFETNKEHLLQNELLFTHAINLWSASRQADLSTLYAIEGQQMLVFRERACHGIDRTASWESCFPTFDYAITFNPRPKIEAAVRNAATPVAQWRYITLWRVNKGGSAQ